jgi:hypothetical protein
LRDVARKWLEDRRNQTLDTLPLVVQSLGLNSGDGIAVNVELSEWTLEGRCLFEVQGLNIDTFDQYLNEVSAEGFGDEFTLSAIADYYGLRIKVFSGNNNPLYPEPPTIINGEPPK